MATADRADEIALHFFRNPGLQVDTKPDLSPVTEAGPPPGIAGLIALVERTRGFGDFLQHMLVAEGAGEVAIDPVMQPWDIAAPQVIVEEAGGRATGLGGKRSIYAGSLVTSNGPL